MTDQDKNAAEVLDKESTHEDGDHRAPGTMVLVLVLLISFVVYYFANWKLLSAMWQIG